MLRTPGLGRLALGVAALLSLSACASAGRPGTLPTPEQQVAAAERAFASTMARRDHEGFTGFLDGEAIFFNGETPIRGREAVAAQWKPFFASAQAPFSWDPDHVEVLPSGDLALSSGPVYDPSGKVVSRFNSVWRREKSGQWRVLFDKGSAICPR